MKIYNQIKNIYLILFKDYVAIKNNKAICDSGMKRSQMVNKMIEVLNETKNASNDVKAKSILAMQTEAGMLAPPRTVVFNSIENCKFYYNRDYYTYNRWYENGYLFYPCLLEWEPEDYKK